MFDLLLHAPSPFIAKIILGHPGTISFWSHARSRHAVTRCFREGHQPLHAHWMPWLCPGRAGLPRALFPPYGVPSHTLCVASLVGHCRDFLSPSVVPEQHIAGLDFVPLPARHAPPLK